MRIRHENDVSASFRSLGKGSLPGALWYYFICFVTRRTTDSGSDSEYFKLINGRDVVTHVGSDSEVITAAFIQLRNIKRPNDYCPSHSTSKQKGVAKGYWRKITRFISVSYTRTMLVSLRQITQYLHSSNHDIYLAQVVTSQIVASPFFSRCKSVSCYLSMPNGEVDTSVLVSEILRAGEFIIAYSVQLRNCCDLGKTLYVPRIEHSSPSHMDLLQIQDLDDLRSLPSGTWGIKEPGLEWNGGKRRPNGELLSPNCIYETHKCLFILLWSTEVLDEECEGLDLILVPGVHWSFVLLLTYEDGLQDLSSISIICRSCIWSLVVSPGTREGLLRPVYIFLYCSTTTTSVRFVSPSIALLHTELIFLYLYSCTCSPRAGGGQWSTNRYTWLENGHGGWSWWDHWERYTCRWCWYVLEAASVLMSF